MVKKSGIKRVASGDDKQLTHAHANRIMTENGLTGNKMDNILGSIRGVFGRKSVQLNFKKARKDKNSLFLDLFASETFGSSSGDVFPVIYCTNLNDFIHRVCENRRLFPDFVKIGFDSGRSSLKATLSLIDTTPVILDSKEKSAFFKDSSVHKSFIVAFGSNLPESYDAMKFLFELLKLNQRRDFKLSGDLKCTNLILGLQSHSSKFPCPFCSTFQVGLDQRTVTKHTPRTFEGIKQQYEAWIESGKPEADLQTFKNCRHPQLLKGKGKQLILLYRHPYIV